MSTFLQAVKSCKDLQVRIVRGQAGTVSGIAKDIEFIKTALRRCGIDNITEVCFDKHVHTAGTAAAPDTVDLQICIEHTFVDPLIFATVFPARHTIVFVNQEFLHDWDLDLFCAGTAKHAAPIPVCKTHACVAALKEMGVPNPRYLGFGDAVEAPVPGAKVPGFFLHVAGKSPLKGTIALLEAWRLHAVPMQKPTPTPTPKPPQFLIITAFDVDGAMRPFFNLWDGMMADLSASKQASKQASRQANEETGTPSALAAAWPADAGPLPEFEVCNFAAGSGVYMCRKMLPAKAIAALGALAAVHVCPSAVEGWGVYIDEGRRAGAVVVTLDAPPMNELVRAGAHAGTNAPANTNAPSGILVKAVRGPSLRLLVPKSWLHYAPKLQTAKYKKKFPQSIIYDWPQFRTWLPAPGALAEALGCAAAMDSVTAAAYGKAARDQSRAEAEAFVDNFSLLLEEFGLIAPAAAMAQRTLRVRIVRGGGEASYGLMRDVEFLSRAVAAAAAASNCRVEIIDTVFDRSRPVVAAAVADVHLADIQIYIEHVANIRGRPAGGPAKRSYLLANQEFFHDRDLDFINDGTVIALCKTHEGKRTISNALEALASSAASAAAAASAPAKRTTQLLSSYKLRTRSEVAGGGQHHNSKVLYIGFGNPAPAPPLSIQTKNPDMVLHVMGKSPLKNTRALVEGWLAAAATELPGDSKNSAFLLIIVYQRDDRTAPFFQYWESLNPVSAPGLPQSGILSAKNKIDFVKGIYLCHDRLSDAEIATLGAEAGVHACPSATEGWGQYIDEGRRAGAVVLTLDAPPMNELVTAASGVLVPAVEGPAVQKLLPQSANEWYPRNYWPRTFLPQDTEALADGIRRALAITRDPEAAAKIGAAAVARSEADAAAFVSAISSIILE